jgi:hypothetical protein
MLRKNETVDAERFWFPNGQPTRRKSVYHDIVTESSDYHAFMYFRLPLCLLDTHATFSFLFEYIRIFDCHAGVIP